MTTTIKVKDREGNWAELEIPTDINLNLMEVLKAYEYPIEATCGGMALCATCHIKVLNKTVTLPPQNDAELDILDTIPDADSCSRLSCQLKAGEYLNGLEIELAKVLV